MNNLWLDNGAARTHPCVTPSDTQKKCMPHVNNEPPQFSLPPDTLPSQDLSEILRHVHHLLQKQQVVTDMVRRQQSNHYEEGRRDLVQALVARQHEVEMSQYLGRQHPADLAFLLENLDREDRRIVWRLLRPDQQGAVLLEVADAVRKSILQDWPALAEIQATKRSRPRSGGWRWGRLMQEACVESC